MIFADQQNFISEYGDAISQEFANTGSGQRFGKDRTTCTLLQNTSSGFLNVGISAVVNSVLDPIFTNWTSNIPGYGNLAWHLGLLDISIVISGTVANNYAISVSAVNAFQSSPQQAIQLAYASNVAGSPVANASPTILFYQSPREIAFSYIIVQIRTDATGTVQAQGTMRFTGRRFNSI